MQKIDEGVANIAKQKLDKMDVEDETDESSKLNAYIELFSNYDDAIRLANKDKEENVMLLFSIWIILMFYHSLNRKPWSQPNRFIFCLEITSYQINTRRL